MTARAPHTKHMSEEDRLAKNARIKATAKATRERRKLMVVRVRDIKITRNQLSARQAEQLRLLFLEAKWVRNAALAASDFGNDFAKNLAGQVGVRLPDGTIEQRELTVLGGQLAQAVMAELRNNVAALGASKTKGRHVGKLRFCREVSSINLAQPGGTHKVDATRGRVKVANITGWMRAKGLEQIGPDDEIANAKLVHRPDGHHLLVTIYTMPRPNLGRATQDFQPGTSVGLDMGVKTHLTLSTGTSIDAVFDETDRLRRLRKKLGRQTKGSANYRKTKELIRVESDKITRRRNDTASKVVHELLRNERVYLQDENISSWKTRSGYVRGGRRVHSSILGRVKTMLVHHERVTVLPRRIATTATCVCGVKTSHHVSKRVFRCPACGYSDARDAHAAKNMIRLGSEPNPTSPDRTGTPVEIGVRHTAATFVDQAARMDFTSIPGVRSRSVKQEAVPSSAAP